MKFFIVKLKLMESVKLSKMFLVLQEKWVGPKFPNYTI